MTGTPTRSDGADSLWLPRDTYGKIQHPAAGTYTLTYGEAVDLGYCRPATFHRHTGRFKVLLEDGSTFDVTSENKPIVLHDHPAVAAQQKALDFYKLAKLREYDADGVTPLISGYHATMIHEATAKLDELRLEMPSAGGLVIAPSIEVAKHFAELIALIEGPPAIIVHSGVPNADRKIATYRSDGSIRWLVSVGMVGEGIDIPRLRVLVYLPNGQTELVFRQAVGRVVRSNGPDDRTRAYVVMPAWRIFKNFALSIEADMPIGGGQVVRPATRCCPFCKESNARDAVECSSCAYEFPPPREQPFRICPSCKALIPASSSRCQTCGESRLETHVVKLADAARDGVIARGIHVDEADVVVAEAGAADYRERISQINDMRVSSFLMRIPMEMMPAIERFFSDPTSNGSPPPVKATDR